MQVQTVLYKKTRPIIFQYKMYIDNENIFTKNSEKRVYSINHI